MHLSRILTNLFISKCSDIYFLPIYTEFSQMPQRILSREQLEGLVKINLIRGRLGLALKDIEDALARPPERRMLTSEQRRGLIMIRALMRRWSVPLAEVEALVAERAGSGQPSVAVEAKAKAEAAKLRRGPSLASVARQGQVQMREQGAEAAPVAVEIAAGKAVALKHRAQPIASVMMVEPAAKQSQPPVVLLAAESPTTVGVEPKPVAPAVTAKRPGVIVTTAMPLPMRTDPVPGSRLESPVQRLSSPYSREVQRKKPAPGDHDYVKYRHPVSGQTWNGLGKQPAWIAQALGFDGWSLEQLKPENKAADSPQQDGRRVLS